MNPALQCFNASLVLLYMCYSIAQPTVLMPELLGNRLLAFLEGFHRNAKHTSVSRAVPRLCAAVYILISFVHIQKDNMFVLCKLILPQTIGVTQHNEFSLAAFTV